MFVRSLCTWNSISSLMTARLSSFLCTISPDSCSLSRNSFLLSSALWKESRTLIYHIQQLWLLASCLVSVAVGAAFTIGGATQKSPPSGILDSLSICLLGGLEQQSLSRGCCLDCWTPPLFHQLMVTARLWFKTMPGSVHDQSKGCLLPERQFSIGSITDNPDSQWLGCARHVDR